MRIITLTCGQCGTIVAANELEATRVRKCPGPECENVLRFEDLPEQSRQFFLENREQYRI